MERKAVTIRDEKPADQSAIREVVIAAFGRAAEADLVDTLRTDGDSVLSLVAEDMSGIIGHALFSRMAAPFRALGLGPVSVLPQHQRKSVGSALIRFGLERAATSGWDGVFVLGDPAYYRRFGFDPELAQGFESPYAGTYLMVLALAGTLPALSGAIGYAPAFGPLE